MKEVENRLFEKWNNPHSNKFIKDGLVDENKYINQKYKVLYILKEANGGENWDLREFLKNGGRKQTWDNIILWHFGIQNINKTHSWLDLRKNLSNKEFRKNQLVNIVALNLKKISGGHTANAKEIWNYANNKNNKKYLREQIRIYNSDIIICCGSPTADIVKSYQLVEKFDNWKISSVGIKYHITKNNQIIVNYCHPEARIDNNYKYFPLINTIDEIFKSKLSNKPN